MNKVVEGNEPIVEGKQKMNHHAKSLLVLLCLSVLATSVSAAEIFATCPEGGPVNIHVRFWADEMEADWQGVVVEQSMVGECETGIIITEEPLQLLDGYDIGEYDFTYPVSSLTTAYRYTVKGMDAGGNLVEMSGGEYVPTYFAIEACVDDALLMRGTLHDIGTFGIVGIEVCGGACWDVCTGSGTVGVIDLDAEQYLEFLDTDTVVNVYGVWDSYSPEYSWGCMRAVRIEEVADCSGSVSVESINWDWIKSTYR